MSDKVPMLSDLPEDKDSSSALVPLSAAAEWQTIVNNVLDQFDREIPDDVVKATEYLICGWPLYKVANRLNRSVSTIRGWLTQHPEMAVAVNYGQRELQRWRMAQLEKQFVSAVTASQDILDLGTPYRGPIENLDSVDPKILALKAQQARFIISLFAGQQIDVKVKSPSDEKPALKAQKDALDYLATRIAGELDNTVIARETTYRVIDVNTDSNGPLLDTNGDPFHGELGTFDSNELGTICHVCGQREKHLYLHVTKGHKMKEREYEMVFMIDRGGLKEYGQ